MSARVLRIDTPRVFLPLLAPARYKGAHGGRGSGKSHFFADLAIEESIGNKVDIVCIREVQRTLDQSVKKLIEQKIAGYNAGDYFDIQDRRILSRQGGVMIFEGMQNHNSDSIKSLQGFHRAWIEEAQSLSHNSLEMLRPTLRESDSELWFGWNPNQPTDPVDALLRPENPKDLPPDAVVVQANFMDNPWFPDVLRQEMEYDRARDIDKFNHVWMGGYQQNSHARVFKNWKIEEFDRPPGTVHRLGADWGYAIDPSVLVRCDIEGKRLYVDFEAWMLQCPIDMLPDLFRAVPESDKWFITADSSRPETIAYLQRHGYPRIVPAVKGSGSIEEGIAFLQSFDIVVHPRCQHVIQELSTYSYKTDPLTGIVLPILEDKNNHCIDALRYACEGARRAGRPGPRPGMAVTE